MRNVKLLLSLYAKSLFGLNRLRYSKEKHARIKRLGILVGLPLLALYVIGFASAYCYMLATSAPGSSPVSAVVFMFSLGALSSLIDALVRGSHQLVIFDDYDLQMSLPVSEAQLALSRLIIIYLEALTISLFLLLPASGVYIWLARPGFFACLVLLDAILLGPAIPVLAGSLLSVLVTRFSRRFRRARYVSILLTLALAGGWFLFCFALSSGEHAQAAALDLFFSASRFYPPARLISRALEGSASALLAFSGLSAAVAAASALLYARGLRRLRSAATENRARGDYRLTRLRSASPLWSLYKREMNRYLSCSVYVLNTVISPLLGLAASIAVIVAKDRLFAVLDALGPDMRPVFLALVPLFLSLLAAMAPTAACSISLEGKAHWIIQVIPVPAEDVLKAKVLVNMTVLLPLYTLCPALLVAALKPGTILAENYFLIPLFFSLFVSELGVLLNLRLHRFDWKSEQQPVKQSLPPALVSFSAMFLVFAAAALTYLLPAMAVLISIIVLMLFGLLACALGLTKYFRAKRGLRDL